MATPEPGQTCALVGVLERSREGVPASLCCSVPGAWHPGLSLRALSSYSVPTPLLLLSGFWNWECPLGPEEGITSPPAPQGYLHPALTWLFAICICLLVSYFFIEFKLKGLLSCIELKLKARRSHFIWLAWARECHSAVAWKDREKECPWSEQLCVIFKG